jgi:hypothetical protein
VSRRFTVVTFLLVLFAGSCSDSNPNSDTLAAVDEARSLWRESGINSYRFTIKWSCFCPPTHSVIEVIDGAVISVAALNADANVGSLETTIDDLFREVTSAARGFGDDGPGRVTAVFDPAFGFPVSVSADPILDATDDEFGWEITGFVALDGSGFEGPEAPGGIHECALLTRGEVDSVLGVDTPLGEYSTPAVTISVCGWLGSRGSLVMTLFPAPDGGLSGPYPDAVPLEGFDSVVGESRDGGTLVAMVSGRTAIVVEGTAEPAELAQLLAVAASRLP